MLASTAHRSLPLALVALCAAAPAAVFHVPGDFTTIQEALNAAAGGDAVVVDPGTYSESLLSFQGKDLLLMSTHPADSAVVAATVIDAGGAGPVLRFDLGEGPGSVVTGLTLTGGSGGGVVCAEGSAPTLRRCLITANEGAGVQILGASPLLENCEISANYGAEVAGGVQISGAATPILRHCNIAGNQSDFVGGGLAADVGSGPQLAHCTLRDNSAADYGGAVWIANTYGGPAPAGGDTPRIDHAPPLFFDCLITGNQVVGRGGGSVALRDGGDLLMDRCRVVENAGGPLGGGFYINASSAQLDRTEIRGNSAGLGGGLFVEEFAEVALTACTVAENSAETGAGMQVQDDASVALENCLFHGNSGTDGAAIYLSAGGVDAIQCTFSGNLAAAGGAAVAAASEADWLSAYNSIFWGDAPQEFGGFTAEFYADYCDVAGGWSGAGNIDADPGFFAYERYAYRYDYFLSAGSPCIDSGDPEGRDTIYDADSLWPADLPDGIAADMGAYGGTSNWFWMPPFWP